MSRVQLLPRIDPISGDDLSVDVGRLHRGQKIGRSRIAMEGRHRAKDLNLMSVELVWRQGNLCSRFSHAQLSGCTPFCVLPIPS